MRLVPTLVWADGGGAALDPRLLPLLRAIGGTGSLTAAVAACGISYRAAWGLLRDCRPRFGEPLVLLERGRGARLSAMAQRLLRADAMAASRLAPLLPALAVEVGVTTIAAERGAAAKLRIAASHDLALAQLAHDPADGLHLDVAFMGSLNALAAYADGRADVAGFHVPTGDWPARDREPFLRGLNARRDMLMRFVEREQGLILPRGNPAQVRHLADIATRGLRFINRQRGSGTRLLIEQLLAREGVAPAALIGYANEEFTHPAVAATVASGGADAGFGLRAAAAEHRLAFVPLVREHYCLAVRRRDAGGAAIARLTAWLEGAAFARLVRGLPGYRAAGAGTLFGVDALRAGAEGVKLARGLTQPMKRIR
jgi:molybdate transport repressor ModE-like protein